MNDLSHTRPLWAEINLDAIAHNIKQVRSATAKDALVTAVIKANAYGHGAVQVAPVMLANGADRLAVAVIDEAIELRQAGIDAPILILGPSEPQRAEEIVRLDLDQTVFTKDLAEALSAAAQKLGKEARIHIKVDSGMGRIGFLPNEETIAEIATLLNLPGLRFEGLFTHFATADEADKTYSQEQLRRYQVVKDGLAQRGLKPHLYHVSNSAAIIDLPDAAMDMVRAGIILYGCLPSNEVRTDVVKLQPTMSIKARITNVKTLPAGEALSYGRKYHTPGERIIATLPVGYADGYTRLLSNRVDVLVRGQRAPVVGNICMDQCMIDVTDIPGAAIGDEVVLIGQQGDEAVTAEEIANILGTISYEVLTNVDRRVPRVYYKNGDIVNRCNYLYRPD